MAVLMCQKQHGDEWEFPMRLCIPTEHNYYFAEEWQNLPN